MTDMQGVDVARWDGEFSRPESATYQAVVRRFLTSAYPDDVHALTIWPTWDLAVVAAHLRVGAGQTLVDLGCGGASPGLWMARHTGARYIGVDPSEVALSIARERAAGWDARLVRGHYEDTTLEVGVADAVVAMDSFHFVPDRGRALAEIARILRGGGRLVMAFSHLHPDERLPAGGWAELLEGAGLRLHTIEPTPGFPERFVAAWSAVVEHQQAIEAEVGAQIAQELTQRASGLVEAAPTFRHVLLVAERLA